jgi:hypothetical protein
MRTCLALCGLALAAPTVIRAQEYHVCANCQAQQEAYQQQLQAQAQQQGQPKVKRHKHWYRSVRVCPNCMAAQQAANGGQPLTGPPMVVAGVPGCAGCEALAAAVPHPAAGGMDQGYAVAGGGDPAPVGVMQASFSPSSGGAPGYAVAGGAQQLSNSPAPFAGPIPGHNRPHIISHILFMPTSGGWWAEQKEKKRAAHAAIPYGTESASVTEVPANVVYGR